VGNLLIPLGIIVLMAVLGQLMNWLKRTAERRQMERGQPADRNGDRPPVVAPSRDPRDISRYLRAVDAQRQKTAAPARPAAKGPPPPPVPPTRKPRLADTAGTAFPEAKPRKPSPAPVADDDLPVAAVVTPPAVGPVVTPPAQLARPARATPAPAKPKAEPTTPFARQFAALLSGPNAAALAVALNEVLGPPKCKRTG
jgi:hypothetical protein